MKKWVGMCCVIFVLASCSSDGDNAYVVPDKVDGTLLKKAVYINTNGLVSTADYTYEGNKLIKIEANSGSSTSYVYTGDKITRINYNFGSLNTESQFLTYNDDGRLESVKRTVLGDITYSVKYTDNDDDTVDIVEYNGDFDAGAPVVSQSKAFIGTDGSVTRLERYSGTSTLVYDYSYDVQFVPTADIIGYDKLRFYQTGSTANPHNVLTVSGSDSVEMQYTYNAQGYASTVKEGTDGPTVKYYYY